MTPDKLADVLDARALLIFDLDGTLVNSSPLHARAFDAAFAPHGVKVDYSSIAGWTTEAAVDRVAARHDLFLGDAARAAIAAEKRSVVRDLIARELVAIDGAVEFVVRAAPHWPLGLCTSGSRATVHATLSRIGLADRFDPLVTAGDVPSKPDPAGYLRVLAHHACPPGDTLIFEDSASGLAAAAAAGVDAICIAGAEDVDGPALARTTWAPLLDALTRLRL